MKIMFMGTPDFAVPSLMRLAKSHHEIIAVVTGPDRPRGRGQKMTETPVALAAGQLGVRVLKPKSVRNDTFIRQVQAMSPDAIVLVAYGQIIPKELLDLPPFGCINLHPSLLPKYRGASPIHAPLLAGDHQTGATTILMNESLDAGHILLQKTIDIDAQDNAGKLHDRLAHFGADLLVETIDKIEQGKIKAVPQKHHLATYAEKVHKTEIDWEKPAIEIVRLIRGLTPFPGVYTYFGSLRINIHGARLLPPGSNTGADRPGVISSITPDGIEVATGDNHLLLTRVQPEGKAAMDAVEFCNGYDIEAGNEFRRID